MSFFRAVKVALTALVANKMRSVLAVLGIVIGVAAVIMVVAMGKGAQAQVEQTISKMGVNLIFVWPENRSSGSSAARTSSSETLTLEDCDAVGTLPHVSVVAPEVRRSYQIKFMNRNDYMQVNGTTPEFLQARDFKIERGEFFDKSAVLARSRVAVLGWQSALDLFGGIDPIGRLIQIDRKNFQVIGVLAYKGGDTWSRLDTSVYVPVTTALFRLFNRRHISQITVSVDEPGNIDGVVENIEEELKRRHRIGPRMEPDFRTSSMNEMRQGMDAAAGAFTMLLMGIASVSLLVGGIGIMNIMLVSVTERTREIGIRKAIGAKRWDILKQFLIESMTISLLGGLLGIAVGVILAEWFPRLPFLAALTGGKWESVVSPGSILLSFLFSCAVGILFGTYPAVKAARLNPVEALRYE
jgi:ABC-type antimicrobial peptide transport system permease subunit